MVVTHSMVTETKASPRYDMAALAVPSPRVETTTKRRETVSFGCQARIRASFRLAGATEGRLELSAPETEPRCACACCAR